MFRKSELFFIIVETPLHPGSGNELGVVDLPIQRERYTNFPKIEASGLKGCFREAFENSTKVIEIDSEKINVSNKDCISLLFGPENRGDEHAGAIAFTDARILLFPVKSLKGVYGWITCPSVLERLRKDLKIIGEERNFPLSIPFQELSNSCPSDSNLLVSKKVVFEEYAFELSPKGETGNLARWLAERIFPKVNNSDPFNYWCEKLKKDLVILTDDDFREFVTSSTEVIARIEINNETGTAENLWYEEYLPQDTIFYSILMTSPLRAEDNKKGVLCADSPDKEAEKVREFFIKGCPEILQIGGNQTLGKGIVRVQFFKE